MKRLFKLSILILAIIICSQIIKIINLGITKAKAEKNSLQVAKYFDDEQENLNLNTKVKEYLTFSDMKNDSNLKSGDVCKTLGYSSFEDGGEGYWNIKEINDSDNLLSFDISNSDLMAEYIPKNDLQINVKALGIKSDIDSAEAKIYNTNILKSLILKYKENKSFYFPVGKYYFNQINIDDVGTYEISLYGENSKNKNSAYKETSNVTICTPGSGFINRTTEKENNETKFRVSNIKFIGASSYDKPPIGICLGTTTDNGYEYNFTFENVYFYGYEYGFKSPGYTSGGSRGYRVTMSHCIYGMYIGGASHNLILDTVDILYCKYGIRLSVGGNPCKISNVHVAVGCFKGIDLSKDPKMYAIHTKGGLIIDSMYYEQYSGELDLSNYTLIDYEGWGNGNVDKLIVKNTPIGNMGAGRKGYFFTGSTFVGEGAEVKGDSPMIIGSQSRNNYFSNGCVEFINCIGSGGIDNIKNNIKNSFNIDGGLNNAFGFTFSDMELFGDGLTFVKNYRRRFNSYLVNGTYDEKKFINLYSTLSIPEDKRVWSNIDFPLEPIYDNAENSKGTHYKGSVRIDKIQSKTTNVTLGIIAKVNNEYVMIREIGNLDSSSVGEFIKFDIDEYIPKAEATNIFFGYKCNGTGSILERVDKNDEKKINYDIEINYDSLEMYTE